MAVTSRCAELLERVHELAPVIRAHASDAEQARCVAAPVVKAMLEAGFFAMAHPEAFGGLELDPVSSFRVVEEVARHDSAAGWNLGISLGCNALLAWLSDQGAAEILETPDLIFGASFNPPGTAEAVDGGYLVSGRWRFASGCQHAAWFVLLASAMQNNEPRLDAKGHPRRLLVFLPADRIEILDTWHTLGMRGTGSHDIEAHDVLVPDRHVAAVAPLEQPGRAFRSPLYRLTLWPGVALPAPPALGTARAAIDDFVELARSKTPNFTATALRDNQVVQHQVAEAEAHLGAGRAFLHQAFVGAWDAAVAGTPIDLHHKLSMQLATTHAVASAVRAVDLVCAAAGTSSIRDELPFGRYFRDVHTMTQHAFGSTQRYQNIGARMLGAESDWGFFDL